MIEGTRFIPYPHMGVFNEYTHIVYLGYTVPNSMPSRSDQRPINVDYFEALRRSHKNII